MSVLSSLNNNYVQDKQPGNQSMGKHPTNKRFGNIIHASGRTWEMVHQYDGLMMALEHINIHHEMVFISNVSGNSIVTHMDRL